MRNDIILKQISMKNKIFKILLILPFILSYISCTEKPQLPIVDFSFENNQNAPVEITFYNYSQFADKFFWDFGDGNYSTFENPTNYYRLPGEYIVKLRATNSEGSAQKKETISLKGITYQVFNKCTFWLYNVIGFYLEGGDIYDLVSFGNIAPGYLSPYVYTTRNNTYIGFQATNDKYFIISEPFILRKNQNNILEIREEMQGYLIDF